MAVKLAALLPVPAGVVTLILPELAPVGTVAVIRVADLTVNTAGAPLNLTAVAPVKFIPFTTTLAPAAPVVGENPVIRGPTAKLVALAAVPPGVATVIGPVVAFAGTVAVICVLVLTVKGAARPLNLTAVAPVKVRPEIVTAVPGAPAVGESAVIVGATAKLLVLVPLPAGVVTPILPVLALTGTVAVILRGELTVNAADAPLKATAVAPVKFAPLITMRAPTFPLVGVNPVIRGATVKIAVLVAVMPAFVTLMDPVVAFAGTVAVIWELLLTVNALPTPLNFTAVAPVNALPVVVKRVPGAPLGGENVGMAGATAKVAALVAVPAGVVTTILPEVAPVGTMTVTLTGVTSVNAAGVPLNVTAVAPVKLAPVTTTLAPIAPLAGVNEVIRGATAKLVALVAVPAGVVTLIAPLVAFAGTVNVTWVPLLTVKAAEVPLSLTAVAPRRLTPWTITARPGAPLPGLKLAIEGPTVTPAPVTALERPPPPVKLTVPGKDCAVVGLNRTVTAWACPAVRLYWPPRTMLYGAATVGCPVSVPLPVFSTTKEASAEPPTGTLPKSRDAGVTPIAGCGVCPRVHRSEVPSDRLAVLKLHCVATCGPIWMPTVACAPPSASEHSPPNVVSR